MNLYDTFINLSILTGVVGGIAVVMFHRKLSVKKVSSFFVVWLLVSLFEYYFLGENSYIHMDEEGDHFVPFYLYLLNDHLGGQFGHSISGGTDIFTSISPSVQLVTPELIWLGIFPIWIAILIHKCIIVAVGFLGSFYLCRSATNADVFVCCSVAALFTVSTHNLTIATYSVGAGLSFLPLLIYTVIVRSNEKNYWKISLPVIITAAIYLDPTHNVEPVFAGLGLAAILFNRINMRVVLAVFAFAIVFLINWAEPLYAMLQMSPHTIRGAEYSQEISLIDRVINSWQSTWTYLQYNRIFVVPAVALAILIWAKDPTRKPTLAVFLIAVLLYPALLLFPFDQIGLGAVTNLSHHYVLLAITGLMLVPLARAATILQTASQGWRYFGNSPHLGGVVVLAVAVGCLGYFKAYNFGNLLYHGGQSQYHSVETAMSEEWRPSSPFRVLTLRVRDIGTEPGLAHGIFGLEPFDAFQMLPTAKRSSLIANGIRRTPPDEYNADPRIFVDWARWKNGAYHGIGEQVSLDLLRLSNVGFILSPIPFADDSVLELVAEPSSPPLIRFEQSNKLTSYLKNRIERILDFTDLYIYKLPGSYPQVFAPTRLNELPENITETQEIATVKASAHLKGFVISAKSSIKRRLAQPYLSLEITRSRRDRDGYNVDVEAPDGGIIALNTIYLPFWTATADGVPLDLVSVNFFQMAVKVPPGTHRVAFSYHRPDLMDLWTRLKIKWFPSVF